MTRRPHSGFVASLDAYERMRAVQRKADGPDAIDEEVRRQVWLEAQREAERLSHEQRSRSGIKLASRHASQHAQGRKRKRAENDAPADELSDADEYSDDSYYSDEYEEEEDDESQFPHPSIPFASRMNAWQQKHPLHLFFLFNSFALGVVALCSDVGC